MDIKKLYHGVNIKILIIEVLFFYIILFIIGYFLNQKYILAIKPISFLLVFLAVITLYYGIIGGILSLAVSFLPLLYFYKTFPVSFFLWNLLMVLIFSEFNFYWNRQIKKIQEENRYYQSKFDELRKNFFFLKLSNEQIEKSYVVKPVSIRNVIQKIKENFITEDGRHYDELIKLIANLFNIGKCSLHLKTGDTFRETVNIGDSISFNSEDPLIKKALEARKTSYMPSLVGEDGEIATKYLAVIPVVIENETKAIFLIEDIPFTNYSKENMMLIDLFLNYSFEDMEILGSMKYEIKKYIEYFNIDFLKEVFNLSKIWEKFKIESVIAAYFLKDKEYEDNFLNFMEGMVRSLDVVCFIKDKGIFFVLLPFTNNAGGKSFTIRVNNSILSMFGKKFLDDKVYQRTYALKNNFNFIMSEINRND